MRLPHEVSPTSTIADYEWLNGGDRHPSSHTIDTCARSFLLNEIETLSSRQFWKDITFTPALRAFILVIETHSFFTHSSCCHWSFAIRYTQRWSTCKTLHVLWPLFQTKSNPMKQRLRGSSMLIACAFFSLTRRVWAAFSIVRHAIILDYGVEAFLIQFGIIRIFLSQVLEVWRGSASRDPRHRWLVCRCPALRPCVSELAIYIAVQMSMLFPDCGLWSDTSVLTRVYSAMRIILYCIIAKLLYIDIPLPLTYTLKFEDLMSGWLPPLVLKDTATVQDQDFWDASSNLQLLVMNTKTTMSSLYH